MNMDFGANKTPVTIIQEGRFGGTYFRDIYSGIDGKCYKKPQTEVDDLKNIDQKYYCSKYYDVSVNKFCAKWEHHYDFGKKGWITSTDPYGWFQWYSRYGDF